MREAVVPHLAKLTDGVHAAGARVALQLGHAGFFTKNAALTTRLLRGPLTTPTPMVRSRAWASSRRGVRAGY